jgi:hypothetical protein
VDGTTAAVTRDELDSAAGGHAFWWDSEARETGCSCGVECNTSGWVLHLFDVAVAARR